MQNQFFVVARRVVVLSNVKGTTVCGEREGGIEEDRKNTSKNKNKNK